MKKLLAFAAMASALFVALPWPAHSQTSSAPRIIHVPQPGQPEPPRPVRVELPHRASATGDTHDTASSADLRPKVTAQRQPRFERRRAYAPSPPEPSGPKRTVLSAPPLSVEGPSPIRPLPRWRAGGKIAPDDQTTGAAPQTTDRAPGGDPVVPVAK